MPWAGTIRLVHTRLETRGARVTVDAEQDDGSFRPVLDIPHWNWAFESSYALAEGVPVQAGKHLRVSCTFDNGVANQWSALSGEPGHGAPARPPQLAPGYLISASNRAAESCTAYLGIERAPYALHADFILDALALLQPADDNRVALIACKRLQPGSASGRSADRDHRDRADRVACRQRLVHEESCVRLQKAARAELENGCDDFRGQ